MWDGLLWAGMRSLAHSRIQVSLEAPEMETLKQKSVCDIVPVPAEKEPSLKEEKVHFNPRVEVT